MDKRESIDPAVEHTVTRARHGGGMYRRAEMRSYAELAPVSDTIAAPRERHTGTSPTLRRRRLVTAAIAGVILAAVWMERSPGPATSEQVTDRQNARAAAAVANAAPAPAGNAATGTQDPPSSSLPDLAQPVPPVRPAQPSLVVISEPAGARVTVDGIGWGITPLTVRYLPPGAKRIRASKDGYLSQDRVVAIAGETIRVQIRLQRRPPSIQKTSIAMQLR